ncbi:hypothetical protein PAXINDRAFT_16003 [Paxillus involutus ATCC 200175]|uniref:Uncharacterized protein n=1 Tax=Paxillus involutus ATCC 200175 TaxID=664439 RepID=A0A0C9TV23_PAXIN|nr:hypothetical protein PAXINDRAFT_16003 [Paxillus involutus ATCC 200175]
MVAMRVSATRTSYPTRPYHLPTTSLPPPPDEPASKPPLSGYVNEMATHLEHPQQELSTMQPRRMPYDEISNGEGGGEAASGDNEVEGSEDDQSTSNGVDEGKRPETRPGMTRKVRRPGRSKGCRTRGRNEE